MLGRVGIDCVVCASRSSPGMDSAISAKASSHERVDGVRGAAGCGTVIYLISICFLTPGSCGKTKLPGLGMVILPFLMLGWTCVMWKDIWLLFSGKKSS